MISEKTLHFLFDLKENNNRDWFQENKPRYEQAKQEFEVFVDMLIRKISEFDASVKGLVAKDCIFRIFRDVRFSKNKEPYKTHFGAYIATGGRKSMQAGYYLHIEPGASIAAGGMYCPESKRLKAIREEIMEHTDVFKALISEPSFKAYFGELEGEKLKTAPRGFPKDFPDVELLKYKSYLFVHNFDEQLALDHDFTTYLGSIFKTAMPFNRFLNTAIDELE